jgi:hypothetical protein
VESNKCWKQASTFFERDNLLGECDRGIIAPVREACREALDHAFCTTLKDAIVGKVDRSKIQAELKRQVDKLPVHRIRHSFNRMSQGKTKVLYFCSLAAAATVISAARLPAIAIRLFCSFEHTMFDQFVIPNCKDLLPHSYFLIHQALLSWNTTCVLPNAHSHHVPA